MASSPDAKGTTEPRAAVHDTFAVIMASRSETTAAGTVRPRHRRLVSVDVFPTQPTARPDGASSLLAQQPSGKNGNGLGQFLEDSISQSWVSVQGFASNILGGKDAQAKTKRYSSPVAPIRAPSGGAPSVWGPQPPSKALGIDDVATGSMAERDAALRAARTASVLESHDGVNGGLDVTGKHKRRTSDEIRPDASVPDDYLVYIHHVQRSDTYAGVILRYKCRDEALRKANGLWSRDSVPTRKWLVVPVDDCEVRGRPCDAPSWSNAHSVDLLARTPSGGEELNKRAMEAADDFFSSKLTPANSADEDKKPWTHVRWVKIDSLREPVEVGRISKQTLGYFPPRRKHSITSASSARLSLDVPSISAPATDTPPRRDSTLSSTRPQFSDTPLSRSRGNSDFGDTRPAWMRRPGGVGTMSRSIRAPGPGKDNFNTWASKHFPVLNTDNVPSMSVMNSETLHIGFSTRDATIAESSFEQGRSAEPSSKNGNGLDRAAATVETWLRGALAKRPNTPLLGARRHANSFNSSLEADFIELEDTASDDGRGHGDMGGGLLDSMPVRSAIGGSTARSDGPGTAFPRLAPTTSKGKKDD